MTPGEIDPADRLATERRDRIAQVAAMQSAHDAIVETRDLAGTDDEHDPDGSTIAFERAQVASLLEDALQQLAAVDAAVRRLAEGTYGMCDSCGRAIGFERLEALPWTVRCVSCSGPRPQSVRGDSPEPK